MGWARAAAACRRAGCEALSGCHALGAFNVVAPGVFGLPAEEAFRLTAVHEGTVGVFGEVGRFILLPGMIGEKAANGLFGGNGQAGVVGGEKKTGMEKALCGEGEQSRLAHVAHVYISKKLGAITLPTPLFGRKPMTGIVVFTGHKGGT